MRTSKTHRRLSTPPWAVVASVAAGTTVVTVGVLPITIESLWPFRAGLAGATPSIGDGAWGAPWDGVAATSATPVVQAVGDLSHTLMWLVLLGVSICGLSLVLHALGWMLSTWESLVVRAALGARWRHLFVLLSRRWAGAGVLGLVGGVTTGVLVAALLDRVWPSLLEHPPHVATILVAGVSTGLALLCCLTMVAVPAPWFVNRRRALTASLQGDRATTGRGLLTAQSLLAVLQFAGLLVVTFASFLLWRDAPGRAAVARDGLEHVTLSAVRVGEDSAADTAARAAAFQTLWTDERDRNGNGVALTNPGAWLGLGPVIPVVGYCDACFVGQFFTPVTRADVRILAVSPGSLTVMDGEIVGGRDVAPTDNSTAEPVVLLNETAAYQLFPGADSIGRKVHLGGPLASEHTVAGVVRRTLPVGPGNTDAAVPVIYVSIFQHPPPEAQLATPAARDDQDSPGSPSGAQVILGSSGPLDREFERFQAPLHFFTSLFLAVAIVATLVACFALVAVMAQTVESRRRDLAIRLALGAGRRQIISWVLRRAVRITGIGIVLGLTGARVIWDVMYQNRSPEGVFSPLTVMALAFAVLALVSSFVPARRATRFEPATLWSTAPSTTPIGRGQRR